MAKIKTNILKLVFIGIIVLFKSAIINAQESTRTIDLTVDTFKEFEVFGDTLDNYSVYFTGENHLYASFNTKFQFKLLRYLHQKQDVKHFIFEQSPGLSYVINKIILEDETAHMLYLKDMFFGAFYNLVGDLRKYNDTLAHADKIQVHGIDIERFPSFSLYALNEMVDTLDKKRAGGEILEQIQALASSEYMNAGPASFYSEPNVTTGFQFGQVSAWESLESIIKGAYSNRDSLKVSLGADSTNFYSIIESLEVGHEWYMTEQVGDVKSPIIRERFMAEEFTRIYEKDMEAKYYGQFGRCHLHKDPKARRCYDYYMNSIANRINDVNPSLENQVLVIPIFYSGNKDYDQDVITSLALKDRFTDSKESYIIDLAYKNGDHSIVGFYNHLPFVLICNAAKDEGGIRDYDWDDFPEELHVGAAINYVFFQKFSGLNTALDSKGLGSFKKQMTAYNFHADYFVLNDQGVSYGFTYFPKVSNGDRLTLQGYNVTLGSSYPLGGKYYLAVFGLDMGFGQMKMIETQTTVASNANPNVIQLENLNKTIYKNDIFTIDPNIQFRLTLPVISLNAKAGYMFDISGKYWKLDGKAKDFVKTSFTAPYVQVGASFNFKL